MKKIKIVTIGGGSSYTPELIEGFIKRNAKLPISELWLVDIPEGKEKLDIVGAMARRMVAAAGLDWKIKLTLDRREALKNADYVTTQFRVGLLAARVRDERIPLSHGMIGQETNGAGGLFKAFRTIPVILNIIEDMKELCPNAWLVNFTNPSGMIAEAAIRYGKWEKTVGLCNVPIKYEKLCYEALNLDETKNELFFKFAGLNHFHWHRVWDKYGEELTQKLISIIYTPGNAGKFKGMENIQDIPFNYEQIKDLNILPCSYHRYYYATADMLQAQLQDFENHETRAEKVKGIETELFNLYKDPHLDHKPEQLSQRGGAYYSDAACSLISAIQNDERSHMVVSTKNNGAISDLPDDCIVEISSIITSHGPEPLNWGHFDFNARGPLQLQKAMEECTIEAAVTGNYDKALQAFTMNPLISSGKIAKELLDEMLLANKDFLPQFKNKIKELELLH
jgi:6-phospho-beta-glucosidase